MNSPKLIKYLSSNLGIDEAELLVLIAEYPIKKVKRDEFLLRANEFSKHTFFIEKGLLRQYSIDSKGKEHTISFAPENWFVSDRESVYFNSSSAYFIQAIEVSEIVMIDQAFINLLSEKLPRFTEFNNKLLHNHIRHLQNRIHMLLSSNAEERYLEFVKMYPDILLRVPQTMVASYLGITPESLSRVRKELAQKNFRK
ncbi:Crp/Fnr family transcriptional regulator [Gelidibacter salicanalis]|uniref:Crp/Fnr family transcriptional regulator n=1 Tax=Gelidibacter salicanalis TaxID=291193 RepID=A0A5C7AF03_9FLAO|nr:Crp/Fnr family transcriptional regulator [Gelidibacter salicanalis]TXE07360.1 Crp/Fnr family transcriptional regulator [Gelidibacter salicanalis]